MNANPPQSSSENESSLPPVPEPPPAPPSAEKQPISGGKVGAPEAVSNSSLQQSRERWRDLLQDKGFMGNTAIALLVLIVLIAGIFYALDGKPLFQLDASQSFPTPISTHFIEATIPSEPTFTILGQYKDEVFTYNSGVDKIYAYNPSTSEEREVISIPAFEIFLWHDKGKLLLVSDAKNVLGNIYVFDLTKSVQSDLEPVLITNREAAPNFARDLKVDGSLPMAWSRDGEAIAFVARNMENKGESLFIYEIGNGQLTFTPARNLDRISSILWISDTQLALVAISDGQEDRYLVNRSGAGFSKWTTK